MRAPVGGGGETGDMNTLTTRQIERYDVAERVVSDARQRWQTKTLALLRRTLLPPLRCCGIHGDGQQMVQLRTTNC